MKRRLISLLMCAVMCFAVIPPTAFAATTAKAHSVTTSTAVKKAAAKKATVKKAATTKKAGAAKIVQTVYWVDKTKIYHTSKNCRTLKKSKGVHSGTLAQAQKSGHVQLCKVCGK